MSDPTGQQARSADAVVIERGFNAPVEMIWQLWTNPEHFATWYGPSGASIPVATMDLRTGGAWHVAMEVQTPNGPRRMWFTGEYRDVTEHRRLAYTESMSDEDGRIITPAEMGMPADHPTTTEVIVEFEDLQGHTRMVLTHIGIPADSPGAIGWTMALNKLAALINARNRT
jgi:uncharacterized protein YndB with AHSA1/START domain